MLSAVVKSDSVKYMLSSFENLKKIMSDLIGIFDETYEGGDFCKGLIFSRQGREVLKIIA